LLSPVATLGLMIDESGVAWPEDRPLNVLLINPGKVDFLDSGQWYRFIPALFGHDKSLAITACGAKRAQGHVSREVAVLRESEAIPNEASSDSVSEVLSSTDRTYDLAVSFTELTHGDELLCTLKALKARRVPLYFTSFSSTHALLNHLIIKSHRATPEPVVVKNPFALVSKRHKEQWNRVVSKVQTAHLPDPQQDHDPAYTEALDVAGAVVLHAHRSGNASQRVGVGTIVQDRWVNTFDGIAVNADTGAVLDLDTDRPLGDLSPDVFDALDGFDPSWEETDRFVWAAFGRYFVATQDIVPFSTRSAA